MKKKLLIAISLIVLLIAGGIIYINANQDKILERIVTTQMEEMAVMQEKLLGEKEGIRVITVGTATPLPSERAQTCTAVFVNGHFFVFDVGDGAVGKMEQFNLPLPELDAVFITHYHSDHYIDLPYLINRSWQMGRASDLEVYGPLGTDTIIHSIHGLLAIENGHRVAHHGTEIMNDKYAGAIPHEIAMENNSSKVVYEQDGIKITAFDVGHEPVTPDFGFKIEYNGKSVVLSGDTDKNENVRKHSEGADLLVHEALLKDVILQISKLQKKLGNSRNEKIMYDITDYHATPAEAAEIAKEAGVKILVLNHLGPVPDNRILKRRFLKGLDKIFDGEIHLAEDGDEFFVQ